MEHFLILFIISAIISSFFIVQFHILTRHYIVVNPDNTESVDGYILKWWSCFWEHTVGEKTVWYQGDSLVKKFELLQQLQPKISCKLQIGEHNDLKILEKLELNEITKIESVLNCKVLANTMFVYLFISEDIYFFPKFIRKPISECVVCMASIFGSTIWVLINKMINLFLWSNNYWLSYFFFGILFLFIVSNLNLYIYRKFS